MSEVSNESIDKLLDDKDFIETSDSYHDYKITYIEYRAKMAEIFARHGLELQAPKSPYKTVKELNKLLSERTITQTEYDEHLKRTLKDIEEESYYKAQQEINKTTT